MKSTAPMYTHAGDEDAYVARMALLKAGDLAIVTGDNSGPGTAPDDNLAHHIATLRGNGIHVVGYVHISYGQRPFGDVIEDIATWRRWYGVTAPFIDEWPVRFGIGELNLMWCIARGYSGKGSPDKPILVVNPGVPWDSKGVPLPGVLVVAHEDDIFPHGVIPKPWEVAMIHSSSAVQADTGNLAANGWQWGWVTSDGLDGNPWDDVSE